MASPTFHLPCTVLFVSFSLLLLETSTHAAVRQQRDAGEYSVAAIDSILPGSSCIVSKASNSSSLRLVHRHGPCSPLAHKTQPKHADILRQDQARVDSLRRRAAAAAAARRRTSISNSLSATLPATTGDALGTRNYVVTIGIGTPMKSYSVIFDTGSDVSWIQCKSCRKCYQQQDPLYDPAQSSTASSIPCTSTFCTELVQSSCSSSSSCLYQVQYGDSSQSQGIFLQDRLTIAGDSVAGFRFGCGDDNSGHFGKTDGLFGLGRGSVSVVSQTAAKYGKVFSYCLPSLSSTAGYLTFGGGGAAAAAAYTPLLSNSYLPTFYFVKLVGIAVAGQNLAISPTVYSGTQGTMLDSGTVISRLPPAAYSALRAKFRQLMASYPTAAPLSLMDTCYNFSGYKTVKVPAVALIFDGGLTVDLDLTGTMYAASVSQTCLAFAGNSDPGDFLIIGNVQQRKFNVVYDLAKQRIGFGPNGCG